ncbi:MAG: hypothetical protein U0575_01845 [Phycisphaerales bacterium]
MSASETADLRRHIARFLAPRGEGMAGDGERASVEPFGARGFAAEIMAWRRSALVVATAIVFVSASVTTLDLSLRWSRHTHGRSDLGVILDLFVLRIAMPWLVCLLCAAALLGWRHLRRSRRIVFVAALLEVLPAFLIAMLPPSWLLVGADEILGSLGVHALRLATAVTLALRIVGVLSAAFRSAVVTKLLVPESAVPGAIVAALTPINVGVSVAMYVAINSFVQGWAFVGAWGCFVAYQLSYLGGGAALMRPSDQEGAVRLFRLPARGRFTLLPMAGVLLLIFLFTPLNSLDQPVISAAALRRHWPDIFSLLTNYAVTLVAGVDLIVHGITGLAYRRDESMRSRDERLAEKARSVAHAAGDAIAA